MNKTGAPILVRVGDTHSPTEKEGYLSSNHIFPAAFLQIQSYLVHVGPRPLAYPRVKLYDIIIVFIYSNSLPG